MDIYLSLQILNLCLFFHKATAVYINLVWSLKVLGLLRFQFSPFTTTLHRIKKVKNLHDLNWVAYVQYWNWLTRICEHLCLKVAGKLSVSVITALCDETGAFLCRIRLGSLHEWWWGCLFCFLREQLKLFRSSCSIYFQKKKKKSVSIHRTAANEKQWERTYFWNYLGHPVINSTFVCQVQDCNKVFGLCDVNY